jgi:hypothetical protein
MTHTQVVLFSSTILLPSIIGLIRHHKIERRFYPFIICLLAGTVNEIISFIVSWVGYSTTLNNNVYVLAEALLILWQFKEWGLFQNYKKTYLTLIFVLILSWLYENSDLDELSKMRMNFRLLYSFLIVLMSIHLNNKLVFTYRKNLIRSPIFLMCCGFSFYFTFKILVEIFWEYGLTNSSNFQTNVYIILTWINGFVNIIYALAILCIPTKPRYISLS